MLLAGALAAGAGVQARAGVGAGAPRPLGLRCVAQADHVRFCQGNGSTDRVPSWDGTPLDADVTLPPTGTGPFPTIVMLHGWGNDKTGFEAVDDAGKGYNAGAGLYKPPTYHYNTDFYARQGYAVLTYTARGKGASCGGGGAPRAQLQTGPCATGFIRLADQRFEARDTQYLLGLLVDQHITAADRIGVTGISYGGGQSLELAYLKDRVRCAGGNRPHDPCSGRPADSFVRWTSPKGVPLSIAASHPRWFWSDLVSALLPNGRFLDFLTSTAGSSRHPIGVEIESFLNGLLATGDTNGYYVTPQPPGGAYAPWDLTTYGAVFDAGEPYGAEARRIVDEIVAHHGGYGVPGSHPSPLLLESGWNDELFPPLQALWVYNDLRAKDPRAPVSLFFGDVGHSAGSNKQAVNQVFNDRTAAFFAHYLKGARGASADGSVTTLTTTCPATVRDGGPYRAASWDALHPGAVELGSPAEQTVVPVGNPATGVQFDAIANSNTCKTVRAETDPGTATYTLSSRGFTLMGLPTISADIATAGSNGQLDARLWDVSPDGQQLLVSRGVYRLLDDQTGHVVFQLHGNGYRFAPGNTVKLELLGSDAPYYRSSNGVFVVRVRNLRASLPVLEAPGSRPQVRANPYRGRHAR